MTCGPFPPCIRRSSAAGRCLPVAVLTCSLVLPRARRALTAPVAKWACAIVAIGVAGALAWKWWTREGSGPAAAPDAAAPLHPQAVRPHTKWVAVAGKPSYWPGRVLEVATTPSGGQGYRLQWLEEVAEAAQGGAKRCVSLCSLDERWNVPPQPPPLGPNRSPTVKQ